MPRHVASVWFAFVEAARFLGGQLFVSLMDNINSLPILRIRANYMKLHGAINVNGRFDPKWEFVRMVLALRIPERKPARLHTATLPHPSQKVSDPSFRGAGDEFSGPLFLLRVS